MIIDKEIKIKILYTIFIFVKSGRAAAAPFDTKMGVPGMPAFRILIPLPKTPEDDRRRYQARMIPLP